MSDYEMPVIVRLSKEELAAALGRAVDDEDVQRLGGLNVVLRPIAHTAEAASHPSVANVTGAADAMNDLANALQPVEEQLFQRLRSNPALAKRFLLNPLATLEELKLIDDSMKSRLEAHARTLAPLFTA